MKQHARTSRVIREWFNSDGPYLTIESRPAARSATMHKPKRISLATPPQVWADTSPRRRRTRT